MVTSYPTATTAPVPHTCLHVSLDLAFRLACTPWAQPSCHHCLTRNRLVAPCQYIRRAAACFAGQRWVVTRNGLVDSPIGVYHQSHVRVPQTLPVENCLVASREKKLLSSATEKMLLSTSRLLASLAIVIVAHIETATAKYNLQEDYSGLSFFNKFKFVTVRITTPLTISPSVINETEPAGQRPYSWLRRVRSKMPSITTLQC